MWPLRWSGASDNPNQLPTVSIVELGMEMVTEWVTAAPSCAPKAMPSVESVVNPVSWLRLAEYCVVCETAGLTSLATSTVPVMPESVPTSSVTAERAETRHHGALSADGRLRRVFLPGGAEEAVRPRRCRP